MVKDFKDINLVLNRHNETVKDVPSLVLRKYKITDLPGEDEVILVSSSGTSVTFTEKDMAIFTLGTHTIDPDEWDPVLQYEHRAKTLVMISSIVKAIGVEDEERRYLLGRLFVDYNGFWLRNDVENDEVRLEVIPENNTLQIYIRLLDKEE